MGKIITELAAKYRNVAVGDLSNNQKKELYNVLKNLRPEDLTTVEDHKTYIELLQKLREAGVADLQLQGRKFLYTLKSLLSVGEDGVYSNKNRFLYELIQNVDDCDYKDVKDCRLDIQFQYSVDPGKIILTYNETGFTPLNVFAITGIAESAKNIDPNKVEIGEKGIGFKSVFGITNKVWIQSGMFSFEIYSDNFTIPVPRYDADFEPVEGTILTLYTDARTCHDIYRNMVQEYITGDAILNKNPILFLNKLTHLKMYVDESTRYLEFNVSRNKPIDSRINREDNIFISVDMADYNHGVDRSERTEITCTRYTMPIVYGKKECISRYGNDTPFEQKTHKLVAIFPDMDGKNRLPEGYRGVLYSFLPTQVKLRVPIILHVPFKLDGSREFVDPQGENAWFTFTMQRLTEFMNDIYLDFSRKVQEDILDYLPCSRNKYLFSQENDKARCLSIQFDDIEGLPIFHTSDDNYKSVSEIVSFDPKENIKDKVRFYHALGNTKSLFLARVTGDLSLYGINMIKDARFQLFLKGLSDENVLQEALYLLSEDQEERPDYKRYLDYIHQIRLTSKQLQILSEYDDVWKMILGKGTAAIRGKQHDTIYLEPGLLQSTPEFRQKLSEEVNESSLKKEFLSYFEKNSQRIYTVKSTSADFVIAADNGIVLSSDDPLSSFAQLVEPFDAKKTFASTLRFRDASQQLNDADPNMSNEEYLGMLRDVRRGVKNILGEKPYESYIHIINESGSDPARFLNELLQNADDCNYPEGATPTFVMSLSGDQLQVDYNETGFTKNNVRALTAIGESTKKKLLNGETSEIGEKGIGFKSVFSVASKVDIHSNGFDFCLTDKAPTIPYRSAHVDGVNGTRMVFTIKSSVNQIFNADNLLNLCLCLRKLKRLTIQNHAIFIDDSYDKRIITIDETKHEYERNVYEFNVSNDALNERESTGRKISSRQAIACYIPDKRDVQTNYTLYSGLPIKKIQTKIPLIIDAPFELVTSRDDVLQNHWNERIIHAVHEAIAQIMNDRAREGLPVLRFVGAQENDTDSEDMNAVMFQIFSDDYLNRYPWEEKLKTIPFLPVYGSEYPNYHVSVNACKKCTIVPAFLLYTAKDEKYNEIGRFIDGTIIDTRNSQKYIELLKKIGCEEASEHEIVECITNMPSYMIANNKNYREGLYRYLKNHSNLASQIINVPMIPIKAADGSTEYVKFDEHILFGKDQVSGDKYFILNDEILSTELYNAIFADYLASGQIQTFSVEFFDKQYINEISERIKKNSDYEESDTAEYILNLFKERPSIFVNNEYAFRGMCNHIPMKMLDGTYKTSGKFVNKEGIRFDGKLLSNMIISPEYEKLAELINVPDIQKARADEFPDNIVLSDEDIEDIQSCFDDYDQILMRYIKNQSISEDQIIKYDLQFLESETINNSDSEYEEEEFPGKTPKNIGRISQEICYTWKYKRNRYIPKKYLVWKPTAPTNASEYLKNMYGSTLNKKMSFCQMCGVKTNDHYIEHRNIEKEPVYAWDQMSLCLCPKCSKDYMMLRNNSDIYEKFIKNIMTAKAKEHKNVDIQIGNKSIKFTGVHLAEVQEIFQTKGYGLKAPKRTSPNTMNIDGVVDDEEIQK